SLRLVRKRRLVDADRPANFVVGASVVLVRDLAVEQALHKRAIPNSLRAIEARTRVALQSGQAERIVLREPLDDDCAAVEGEAESGIGRSHAGPSPSIFQRMPSRRAARRPSATSDGRRVSVRTGRSAWYPGQKAMSSTGPTEWTASARYPANCRRDSR